MRLPCTLLGVTVPTFRAMPMKRAELVVKKYGQPFMALLATIKLLPALLFMKIPPATPLGPLWVVFWFMLLPAIVQSVFTSPRPAPAAPSPWWC